jgi:flagellar hook-basal body complex protein FliE
MVDRIGQGSLAKNAIEAALRRQAEAAKRLDQRAAELSGTKPEAAGAPPGFSASLAQGLHAVDTQVKLGDQLAQQVIEGKVTDFAEVAAQLKQSDLAFKFALEVRNKFVDAYREVMRMSV